MESVSKKVADLNKEVDDLKTLKEIASKELADTTSSQETNYEPLRDQEARTLNRIEALITLE